MSISPNEQFIFKFLQLPQTYILQLICSNFAKSTVKIKPQQPPAKLQHKYKVPSNYSHSYSSRAQVCLMRIAPLFN